MPVSSDGTTTTLQDIVNSFRAYSELTPIIGTSGWEQEPAVTIANDVMSRILAEGMNWKWNRAAADPFLTVSLQQDYITNITDMGWLEQAWKKDINNTANPKPIFSMETIRDMAATFYQGYPFNMSWIPNALAIFGTWKASTFYPSGTSAPYNQVSPIQQFIDANGNFLFVTAWGISGTVQPVLPANSAAGTTVIDGAVTWTVADPNGFAFRLGPLPSSTGIVWEIHPIYQKKPPLIKNLSDSLTPIPDSYMYLFRQGFLAMCYEHAGSAKFGEAYGRWIENMVTALRAGDRERDFAILYPSEGFTGGSPWNVGLPIGPGWPYFFPGY
jgi:hypothetical protein